MLNRADGRSPGDLRAPKIQLGVVSDCAGSASVEQGKSHVVCCVRGPVQLTSEYRGAKGKVSVSVSISPFALKSRRDSKSMSSVSLEKALGYVMEGICEQVVVLESFPQLCFELSAVIILSEAQGRGGDKGEADVLAADVGALSTAVCAALAAAGVELKDVFTGVSMATLQQANGCHQVVDPTGDELGSATSVSSFVVGTATSAVYYSLQEGSLPVEIIAASLDSAVEACKSQREVICKQL
jgi:ribonuclease PH